MAATRADPVESTALLERERPLELLAQALSETRSGRGRLVFVDGEAGAGKTALLRTFLDAHLSPADVHWGACDPLFTPRPLGPFLDVAEALGGELRSAVESGAKPYEVATTLMRLLASGGPQVLVLEDLHWADEASLDVLRILGRRIEGLGVLVLASYRSDELGRVHPLRIVLGELAPDASVRRCSVAALSPAAVAELAAPHAVDAEELYAKTAGNPFFVSEVLASGGSTIPDTVRDLVLARAARLCARARDLLDALSVAPEIAPPLENPDLPECLDSGLLTTNGSDIAFRHELTRQAIESSLTASRRAALHRQALELLAAHPPDQIDVARLAHHAEGAGDREAVLRYAPAAASRAAAVGSHREAAAQYARALRFADELPLEDRARLLDGHSYECWVTTQDADALVSIEDALACYRQLGDDLAVGTSLRWRGLVLLNTGYGPEAIATTREAIAVLERLPPGHELAMSYHALASLASLDEREDETVALAKRALEIAEQVASVEGRISALSTLGFRQTLRGASGGWELLDEALELARSSGLDNQVGRVSVLVGMAAARERSLPRMGEYVLPALAFCDQRDLDVWGRILLAMRGWLELEAGSWDDATTTVAHVLSLECSLSSAQANIVLGLLRARRGDPDPWTPLNEAGKIADRTGQLWWTAQVAAAKAETAWLAGRPELVRDLTEEPFAVALERRSPWPLAELAFWRSRAGVAPEPVPGGRGPFATQLEGDWKRAATEWADAGCPYEAALALADGDDRAQRQALADLTQLGARPAAAIVARRMREQGARQVPRGPRPSTRANPGRLTARELEVLELIAEGHKNADIASTLYLSRRTVDHHVSAVLRKLDARTRGEAVVVARRIGALQDG